MSLSQAQVPGNVPMRLSQYYIYRSQINPAALPDPHYRFSVAGGQQNYLGPLNIVRTIFSEGSLTFPNKKGHKHAVGVLLLSHKEGELLSYTRGYLQYAFLLPLSSKWRFSAGIKAGFVRFFAEQTATSRLLSSHAPDVGVGLELQNDRQKIGVTVGQVLNSTLRADVEILKLNRLYGLYMDRKIPLSPYTDLFLTGIVRMGEGIPIYGDVVASFIFKETLLAGAGLGQGFGKGLFFNLGILDQPFYKGGISAVFSYNSSFFSFTSRNIQTVEVTLRYKFSRYEE